jgi:hypothetical protein
MKIFRFMSYKEFEKYMNGENLYNNTKHKAKTNSIGFCFFDINDFSPEFAWRFLKGAIFPDICVVFEVDETLLRKGYGIYSDPNKTLYELMNFIPKMIRVSEYCTENYNKEVFKLVKYTTNKLNFLENYKNFDWREI